MTEAITRIQFSREEVTIYSTDGVFAIWQGKKARVLSALVTESIQQIIEREALGKLEVGKRTDQASPFSHSF